MHDKTSRRNDNAVTGLEIIILLVIIVLVIGYIGSANSSYGKTNAGIQKQKKGMIANNVVAASNLITDPGGMVGYPAVDSTIDGIPVKLKSQNPGVLGVFEFSVQPFMMTTGSIDMGHASIVWKSGNDQEKLALVQTPVLVCPNWTIVQKSNFIPTKGADQDLFLEGSEQFTVLVCPAGNVAPNQQFTLTVAPENGELLPLTRTVPPGITPVTNLG
jgi:hypothetical protein